MKNINGNKKNQQGKCTLLLEHASELSVKNMQMQGVQIPTKYLSLQHFLETEVGHRKLSE